MTYPVIIRPAAHQQLEDIARWWAENHSPQQAERWFSGFVDSIKSLSHSPGRCSLAVENHVFEFEIRELHYGLGKRPTHRALFTIRPDMVYVLLIRHLAQREISAEDLF